ncbi:hypothetical protein MMC20_006651 [Loxospora ochrophaea]|nr:hypothetical protein [Loxospora ochrophaea]
MAPLRRYLRLSPHSVIELRIYLDNPADLSRWLLREPDPALPKVMQTVKPLVKARVREERDAERERRRGGKGKKGGKKGVRDVMAGEGFEVSVFLTEGGGTRHTVLRRGRVFHGEGAREEEEEDGGEKRALGDIPVQGGQERQEEGTEISSGDEDGGEKEGRSHTTSGTTTRRGRIRTFASTGLEKRLGEKDEEMGDDKKKKAFRTEYEGFAIYGKILCLVIKRRGVVKGKELVGGAGQAMMEEWIRASQVEGGGMLDE